MASVAELKDAGSSAYAAGKHTEALYLYTQALDQAEAAGLAEGLHILFSNRAAARLALRDYAGALQDAQAAVAVEPSWTKGWYRSGVALLKLNRPLDAANMVERALQLDSTNKEVLRLKTQVQQQQAQAAISEAAASAGVRAAAAPGASPAVPLDAQAPSSGRCLEAAKLLPAGLRTGSVVVPSADGINENVLLMLHGLGDTPGPYVALAKQMALPQTACIVLAGPLSIPETDGGCAWFKAFDDQWELIQPRRGEKRRWESLQQTLALMEQLLGQLEAAGGWQRDQIHLLGFSQGGTVALELMWRLGCARKLGSCVAIAASLLPELLMEPQAQPTAPNNTHATPVLITRGTKDTTVPEPDVQATERTLRAAGCSVQLHSVPGKGHAMVASAQEMQVLMTFWAAALRQRPPTADGPVVEIRS